MTARPQIPSPVVSVQCAIRIKHGTSLHTALISWGISMERKLEVIAAGLGKRNKQWRRISAALNAWKERRQSRGAPDGGSPSIEIMQSSANQQKTHGFGNRRRA